MNAVRRLTVLVDSCLLPSVSGAAGRLPDWILRGLERGTPGIAVHAYGSAARSAASALRAALPDALTGHPGPRRAVGGRAAAAELVATGANLHLGVRPGPAADETRVFVTDLQTHGVAAALGPFTGAGSLRPFAEGAAAGVRAITAGHSPADSGRLPAALDVAAITGILRGELGYGGVVVSDALDAPSIVDGWGVPGAAVLAWIAGVDLVRLGPSSGAGVRNAIHAAAARAVADGDLDLARLEEAADRVARLRRWASEPRMPDAPDRLHEARPAAALPAAAPATGDL
ncbi:glycoside hydrolase family 3 N-terminal domain-containing protein [Streptomyces sp. V4-01]|uniref:Glycoside hydrolase family 3 N-terminal domain-containing protein n=1 Tax=Actinacidiphila polyblastidii TaxID=3110430 RepID=A0ABU7PB47_9ACTN|nr:glycoside hydrolase family 3 N-terminal domain-containing protein [Streptomyces sp. V4-01]